MPIIQVEMLEGRTVEQKREMVKRVTQAVADTVNCPKDAIKIIIREMDKQNYAEGGILKCDK